MVKFRPKYLKDYIWQSKLRKLIAWIIEIAIVVALAFGVTYYFGRQATVADESMEPTLAAGQTVLINSAVQTFSNPKRGDIIAFRAGDSVSAPVIIKRVVGLPGETVTIKEGQIYIDGEIYVEKRDFPLIINPGLAEGTVYLGGTEYFVLGDSRNNSEDSRHVDVGNIDDDLILGVVWAKLSPFGIIK